MLYRARDTVLGREVAVKVMTPGFLGETARRNASSTKLAAARLHHLNIVTMFEFGEQDETPHIVMEFLRGFSLAERLRKAPVMTLREKLDIAIQLCAGLDAAHKLGVVHRDVRPANMWICHDGTVKLLDFGIATAASSAATMADVLGSPGAHIARTDRRRRRRGAHRHLLGRRRHLRDAHRLPPLRRRLADWHHAEDRQRVGEPIADSEVPPALAAAAARAMAKDPADRYVSAADLGRDLKTVKSAVTSQRDTATMVIDRGSVAQDHGGAATEAPHAERAAAATRQHCARLVSIAADPVTVVVIALAAAIIGRCASRPAL